MLRLHLHPKDIVTIGDNIRIIVKYIDYSRASVTVLFDVPREIPIVRKHGGDYPKPKPEQNGTASDVEIPGVSDTESST